MMASIVSSIAIFLIAFSEFSLGQNYKWSPCSRTCGQGTRSRKCKPNDPRRCQYRYADCEIKDCPIAVCTTYKYGTMSNCCRNEPSNECGVVQPKPGKSNRRIIGGVKSEDGQWPWQVAMRMKEPDMFVCGAALLNERWILTAAHCFTDNPSMKVANNALAVAGISRLDGKNPDKQSVGIEKFILHPRYKDYANDLALAKVYTPFQYSTYVHPICLPGGEVVGQDTICYTAGWGYASVTARTASNDLLHVGLRVLPLAACKEAYRGEPGGNAITNKIICAGILSGGKDTCSGDSGSPLVCQRKNSCQWFVAGVVAFGPSICGIKEYPAAYSNVQKYQGWVELTMKKNSRPDPKTTTSSEAKTTETTSTMTKTTSTTTTTTIMSKTPVTPTTTTPTPTTTTRTFMMCRDENKHCSDWAIQGECRSNPLYMLVKCRKSCNQCGRESTMISTTPRMPMTCHDVNQNCSHWASKGECQSNPLFMLVKCKKSCNNCERSTTNSTTTNMPSSCHDESQDCSHWARIGECTTNPLFMLVKCKKSCNQCEGMGSILPSSLFAKSGICKIQYLTDGNQL